MGFLKKVKELCKKTLRTNPALSMRVEKKKDRGLPRKERVEIGGKGAEAKEETLAEIGNYRLSTPVWSFDMFEDPEGKRKRRRKTRK